ncbi:four helix bundle protein [Cnuella takakiae]|uniref:Four helix bundle protein n=1 Tax=Cnuella takakiae TaxID=1302690 RepID=A0A1M5FXP7_9BACT|nr:four helix bundle protein [Cnuella takakiae]OLY92248.1 four helix bundle protein [Cnuella takakiae]SHF96219.1 four helix bundle protein [Cnuella takakiae]
MIEDEIRANPLLRLSINFSILVIQYCEVLDQNRKHVIGKQLLRAATSIGANAMEAQNAESKADFIHKMKVAGKEADETQYWLILCKHAKSYPDCSHLFPKLEELQKILNAILGSSK